MATLVIVATWDDVRRIATALPEVTEQASHGLPAWRVSGKLFAWERPLRKGDIEALGPDAPGGPILGARVADLGVKEALLADDPAVFLTTPHFDGYPAVLVRLGHVTEPDLAELITEAWLARAPKRLAAGYLHAAQPRPLKRAATCTPPSRRTAEAGGPRYVSQRAGGSRRSRPG